MRCVGFCLCLYLGLGHGRGALGAPVVLPEIAEIRFEGNARTEPQILLQEMTVRPGDPASPEEIEASRQFIMDLGLFKRVWTELIDAPQGGQVLVVHVEEKFYLVPLPLLDARMDGEINYGFDMRFDNLAGRNQRLQIGYENQNPNDEHDLARQYRLQYRYPRIFGSPFQLDVGARFREEDLNEQEEHPELPADYLLTEHRLDFTLARWLRRDAPSRGWRAGAGFSFIDRDYAYHGGVPGLFESATSVSLRASLEFLNVHEYPYYRRGGAFGWQGELGLSELGSDEAFSRHLFYWRRYELLGADDRSPALNTRLQLGLATGGQFQERAYDIGGGDTLRGHPETDDGNAMLLANLEYLVPMPRYPQLRGVLFADVGNVYPQIADIDPADLKFGTGVGLRWRFQTFVDLTLAADMAYGVDEQEVKFYAGTSATF